MLFTRFSYRALRQSLQRGQDSILFDGLSSLRTDALALARSVAWDATLAFEAASFYHH
jgi:hypothetical protein